MGEKLVILLGGALFWLALAGRRFFPALHPEVLSPRSGRERATVAAGMLLLFAAGYTLQFLVERGLGLVPGTPLSELNWRGTAVSIWLVASVTSWVILSSERSAEGWRGATAAMITLTLCDFNALLAGGTSYRSFLFSSLCNLVGSLVGVWLVLGVKNWLGPIRQGE